jgi:hypothetical protein
MGSRLRAAPRGTRRPLSGTGPGNRVTRAQFLADILACGLKSALQAVPQPPEWLPWERLKDGAGDRIYLRGNDPGEKLGSDRFQVRNGYARTVIVALEVTDHGGDAPRTPRSRRTRLTFTLRPGEQASFRTPPSVSVAVLKVTFR